jgi:hypothetical protein
MKRKSSRFPDLTTVYTAAGLTNAQVIKAKLEAAGIQALLDYESVGPIIGITVDGLGEVRVLVSNKDAEEARSLIEEEDC